MYIWSFQEPEETVNTKSVINSDAALEQCINVHDKSIEIGYKVVEAFLKRSRTSLTSKSAQGMLHRTSFMPFQ